MLLSQVLNDYYVLPLGQSEIVGYAQTGTHWHITWSDSDTGDSHDQEFMEQEIQQGTERGAFNVTNSAGELCGFIALEGAALKPERLVITLDGGLVQGVLSEQLSCQVAIVDYDTDGADEDELVEIPQDDDMMADAYARIEVTTVDPEFVNGVFAVIR